MSTNDESAIPLPPHTSHQTYPYLSSRCDRERIYGKSLVNFRYPGLPERIKLYRGKNHLSQTEVELLQAENSKYLNTELQVA